MDIFKYFDENNSDTVRNYLANGKFNDVFKGISNIINNQMIINYSYFKYTATANTYDIIIQLVINNIDIILQKNPKFIVHFNMRSMTISEYDKHKNFIYKISDILKTRYHDQLDKCYLYNPPFIFEKIYNLVSVFIDKDTLKKIELVKNN